MTGRPSLPLLLISLLALSLGTLRAQIRIDPRHENFIYFPELGRMIGTQSVHTGQSTLYPIGDANYDGLADWILKTRPDTAINGTTPYEIRLYHGIHGGVPSPESGQRIGPTEIAANTQFIAAGDWDGDTWTDIAVRVSIHYDTSGGNTQQLDVSRFIVFWGGPSGYTLNDTTRLENGEQMWLGLGTSLSVDADGDHVDDLVLWTGSGMTNGMIVRKPTITIFRGHRGERWGRNGIPRTADWGWWTPPEFRRFTAIDQNCDGALDLIFHNDINSLEKPSTFSILYGNPDGGLPDTSALITLDMTPINGHAALFSDISGDGVPELIISCLDEVIRIYAGEPGVNVIEQFGTGDDPPDTEHGRWYRRPWAELPLPRSMHDGWAFAGSLPPLDLGDANLDGINDIFTRSWPLLIEYNTMRFRRPDSVRLCVLDSLIDGIYRAPEEEITGTVRVGDIDGSGISSIAVTFLSGVAFIKPTTALPESGTLRLVLHGPGVRCQSIASVAHPHTDDDAFHLRATPNPATGLVHIHWQQTSSDENTHLSIYDMLGQQVALLTPPSGATSLTWDAAGLPGGRYFLTLSSDYHSTTTIVLVR